MGNPWPTRVRRWFRVFRDVDGGDRPPRRPLARVGRSRSRRQLRKVFRAKLRRDALAGRVAALLQQSQLDAPDLAGDRLWKIGKLEPTHTLVGRQSLAHESE